MDKIHLIFAGRLSYEKGFDLVVDFCHQVKGSEWEDKIHIHIYGSGVLQKIIPTHSFVSYYGQRPKDEVVKTRKKCLYSLMPSRFLETFGLSALDSLALGVPVIGFRKGGLLQFGEGIIDATSEETYISTIFEHLKKINSQEYLNLSMECKKIASVYTWDNWKIRFEKILGRDVIGLHTSLLSDYCGNIGGIESYISHVIHNFKQWGTVSTTLSCGLGGKNNLLRYLLLPLSVCNVLFLAQIKSLFKKDTYDVIRRHSVQRYIGRLPVARVGKNTTGKKLLMVHDFGVYHPFPSHIYSKQQLLSSLDFTQRIKAGFERFGRSIRKKILRFIPLYLKFLSSKMLVSTIEAHIDIILVPSEYMKTYLSQVYTTQIEVLPHPM